MRTTTVVIGAGHAGLAISRCLTERSIDHVVLERGEVANSWKKERWDSLRLLTPNWQSRLPGYGYRGDDPDGFRSVPETVAFLERYAEVVAAPVRPYTTVAAVRRRGERYLVVTDQGEWQCRAVVIATGACNLANVPAWAAELPNAVESITPLDYRTPDQLAPGGVLVVGASASGTQIAREIHRSGRPVTLAVGEHVRVPRTYRGRDIQWWMDRAGVLDDRYTDVDSVERARAVPSLQLAGSDDRHDVDLNALTEIGVRLAGRLAGIADGRAVFSGSLRNVCQLADLKLTRLLDRIDRFAADTMDPADVLPSSRPAPTRLDPSPTLGLSLAGEGIRTVLWATGYRPDHSWLEVPVFDRKGRVRHDGGVVEAPGLYLIGMPFLRRRKSSLIDGAGDDARDLSAHLAGYLDRTAAPAPHVSAGPPAAAPVSPNPLTLVAS